MEDLGEAQVTFGGVFKGKNVLVTGHTGFKGAWLSAWLNMLGAKVYGLSIDIPTTPSMFEAVRLESKLVHKYGDIRNAGEVTSYIQRLLPDFVFHLAAQPLVSVSYEDPLSTITTNVLGTANILNALRGLPKKCIAVIITSDKAYENREWLWGYRETDHLGGKDIYSASKGAAELVFHAFQSSFFSTGTDHDCRVVTVRAGNVIGGGDWARDRIVADTMRAWSEGHKVRIRSPYSTRPWQHVLEPLSGYLSVAAELSKSSFLNGESFNFGPRESKSQTVFELLSELSEYWGFSAKEDGIEIVDNRRFHEAGLLKLNCDKAQFHLGWEATLEFKDTVRFVGEWYKQYYSNTGSEMAEFTNNQIDEYVAIAVRRELSWAQ